MKNLKNKKTLCLAAVAVLMVLTLSVGSAMAYFSTYVISKGSKLYEQEFPRTELDERISAGMKSITIKNVGNADGKGAACFVRVKVIAADAYESRVSVAAGNNSESDWYAEGDYYYYNKVLELGELTTTLDIHINTENLKEAFNVVVIQENTPALYNEKGEPYADWDRSEFVVTDQFGETVNVRHEIIDIPEEE